MKNFYVAPGALVVARFDHNTPEPVIAEIKEYVKETLKAKPIIYKRSECNFEPEIIIFTPDSVRDS